MNPLHPRYLSTRERLGEVCRILARGIVRLRMREAQHTAQTREIPLHFSPDRSGGANPNPTENA